jgi:tetratricopeptide (TPR) repeat protein
MKRKFPLFVLSLAACALYLASFQSTTLFADSHHPKPLALFADAPMAAPGGQAAAAKAKTWKSRDEYDAFNKIVQSESNPKALIPIADAFIQKYPTSDFKDQAYLLKLQAYQKMNDSANAIAAANDVLKADPDNLYALNYLSFAFPFIYKADEPNKDAALTQATENGKHGLDLLQKLQKPANLPQDKFDAQVKQLRGNFNRVVGFAALQRKDYATAITSLKAAIEDQPNDTYSFSFLGQAYLYSTPPDFDNAIWNLARSAALAKAVNQANTDALTKFFNQVYESRHGSNAGEQDVLNQAATSVAPPAGFKVAPPQKHAPTGNASVDGFYQIEDALVVGGDAAQKAWDSLKGQPLGLNGVVDSVQPGTDPSTYLVHVDITDEAKAKDGVYDLELQTTQPGAKYLSKGDGVRFQGTISAYTVAPSFVLTLADAKINDDDLKAAEDNAKSKKAAHPTRKRPTHHTAQ